MSTLVLAAATASCAAAGVGGPVILGGDIKPRVGRANDNTIAALGSADPGPLSHPTGGDAARGIENAAEKNGMRVRIKAAVMLSGRHNLRVIAVDRAGGAAQLPALCASGAGSRVHRLRRGDTRIAC